MEQDQRKHMGNVVSLFCHIFMCLTHFLVTFFIERVEAGGFSPFICMCLFLLYMMGFVKCFHCKRFINTAAQSDISKTLQDIRTATACSCFHMRRWKISV